MSLDRVQRISSGGQREDAFGYSRAVAFGPWVLVSGCTAVVDGEVSGEDDAYAQTTAALEVAMAAVHKAGGSRREVVRTRMYVTNIDRDSEAVGRAHGEFFGDVRPATSMVEVSRLIDSRLLIEVEMDVWRGQGG